MTMPLCLDASVIVKVLTREEHSEAATRLLEDAIEQERPIVLPDFALLEVGSVLRQKTHRELITVEQADKAWHWFRRLQIIGYMGSQRYADKAWDTSRQLRLPTLYDAAYLAVAETAAEEAGAVCEFWTADEKLFNQVSAQKSYARLVV
ncbi:MAG: type II toxin-antitoxin system VapC family toxin [Firmicutes bacterium]|nr:type II toxin-antitoxin system VapC family toxin [Bacillota bacterium]